MDLQIAQQQVLAAMADGTVCPCCHQYVKLYSRKLNGSMACALIFIYRFFTTASDPWLHVPSYLTSLNLPPKLAMSRGGDWAKLKLWELIAPQPGTRDDGSTRNGYWKITPAGRAFVQGTYRVPKIALIFNQTLYGFRGPRITIQDALGDRFDYNELMSI